MAGPFILAIDAATRFGFAYGRAGTTPISGSDSFAKGTSPKHGAVFAGAIDWLVKSIQEYEPDIIAMEQPLPTNQTHGFTNANTELVLKGLYGALYGISYKFKTYDFRTVRVSGARKHFIGKGNLKGPVAKPLVMQKCRALGWIKQEDLDHTFDRSDALAIWSFVEAESAPKITQPVDDLFVAANRRDR